MPAYYNEIEPFAAQWLRNLIAAGLIAPGDVDERSIKDVSADDLKGYTQCHFFAGIGGWSEALRIAGWPDDQPVWTGSCPCQPFSAAGKRRGFADDRHLWPEWFRLIRERCPATVFGEQVASATDWLRLVRGDLEALEYAVGAMPIEAASAGADHLRDRFWFVANGTREQPWERGDVVNADQPERRQRDQQPAGQQSQPEQHPQACALGHRQSERGNGGEDPARQARWDGFEGAGYEWVVGADGKARCVKSGIRLLVDGVSGRVAVRRPAQQAGAEVQEEIHWYNRIGALKGLGNAIDPRPAAAFIGAAVEAVADLDAGVAA